MARTLRGIRRPPTIAAAALLLASLVAEASAGPAPALRTRAVDPLVKVFPDETPGEAGEATTDVARGEPATLQVAVRCDGAIGDLRAEAGALRLEGGDATLAPRPVRFFGFVPVDRPMQDPPHDVLRKAPADFPDPLLEVESVDVPAGRTQALWVTVPVPADARPGTYRGELALHGTVEGVAGEVRVPLRVVVHPVVVDRTRLRVTNWFSADGRRFGVEDGPGGDAYLALLRRYARNMAEHRQNVALISPLRLATFAPRPDGSLDIGFDVLDRWVEVFVEEGVVGLIEGGHLGGRAGGWRSPFVVEIRRVVDGRVVAGRVPPDDPEAERFLARFLPALVEHLQAKGWLGRYVQHLADEPIPENLESYRALAALVRKHAPALRIVEACHAKDLVGSIDVWVPQLNHLARDLDHYRARQRAGEEVWFYTCVFPQGEYANRFIELPLLKTRILPWIAFVTGATGYLHWGYDQWTADPFTQTTRPHPGPPYLPAGDAWIVYPGRDGPLDSVRHEAMRDGIVDHELLCRLAERDPAAARALAARHVLALDRYDLDVEKFRATRRELLERLGE